jgi:hypothetical protein
MQNLNMNELKLITGGICMCTCFNNKTGAEIFLGLMPGKESCDKACYKPAYNDGRWRYENDFSISSEQNRKNMEHVRMQAALNSGRLEGGIEGMNDARCEDFGQNTEPSESS